MGGAAVTVVGARRLHHPPTAGGGEQQRDQRAAGHQIRIVSHGRIHRIPQVVSASALPLTIAALAFAP
jgi:hypothetical protein